MAVMLYFLASTAYFLQLSDDKLERQNIINSDRWQAKILSFPLYESRDQRDCAKSYFSQFKFLRLIQKISEHGI